MSEPHRRLIDEALARFLDGEPEPDDGALLAEAMRADEHFAREVGRLLMVDDLLRQSGAPDDRAFLDAFALRLAAEREGGEFVREFERRVRDGGRPAPPRRTWLPWTIAAAACVASVLAGGLAIRRRPGVAPPRPAAVTRADREAPAGGDRPITNANALAMVVKLDGVEWEPGGGPHPTEGDLLAAVRLRLRSGRATLSMLTGAVLVAEGPADVELVSADVILCHRGKLRARVPEEAEGFVISGPGSAVVDLGTEFGLNIGPDGQARGKVFEGEVEAAVFNDAGTSRRSQLMGESEAFRIDPRAGRIEALTSPEGFIAPSDLASPALVLGAGYRDAILRSRPWGYWRFEAMAGGAIPNEIPGRPPLRATGPIRLSDPSQGNPVAVFGPGQTGQYLSLDDAWEQALRPGFAVELWFMPESIRHAALASMIAPRDTNNHLFLLEVTSLERVNLHRPASVRVLHRWPPGPSGGDNIYSEAPYRPYRWHHLVGQVGDDRLQLFIDGESADTLPIDPGRSTSACQLLLGRLTTIPIHGRPTSRPFVGRMDEVALYDHPLKPEEIQNHFHLAATRPARRE